MKINPKIKQELLLLGQHIKKLRLERNLTILEVSRKTKIRKIYLEKIENGTAYGVQVYKHLLKIAIAFQIKFFDLFDYK